MAGKRLSMRKIREILRLRWGAKKNPVLTEAQFGVQKAPRVRPLGLSSLLASALLSLRQSEVDVSPRSWRITAASTERSEVNVRGPLQVSPPFESPLGSPSQKFLRPQNGPSRRLFWAILL